MHDMLEGIVPQLESLMLVKFKEQKLITVEKMNRELNINFINLKLCIHLFCSNEWKNKPVPFVMRTGASINFLLVLHHRSFLCFIYYRL